MNKESSKSFFNLRESKHYFVYRLFNFADSLAGKIVAAVFWLFFILGLFLIGINFLQFEANFLLWGLRLISVFWAYKIFILFYTDQLKEPIVPIGQALRLIASNRKVNLADLVEPRVLKTFCEWEYCSREIAKSLIGLEELNFVISRAGLNRKEIKSYLSQPGEEVGSRRQILIKALQIAQTEGHSQIGPGDLFVALCLVEPTLKELIDRVGLTTSDLLHIVYWYNQIKPQKGRFLDTSGFIFNGGVAKDWVFGYQRELRRFSVDITEFIRRNSRRLKYIGHRQAIAEMEKNLVQSSAHNVVLVAEEGSGKKTAVYGLARRMARGESFYSLNHRHILEIDLDALLAGAENAGAIIQRLNLIFSEAIRIGNTILFFEDITNLLSSKSIGQVNAAEVLIPFLNSPDIYIISTTTPGRYHRYISNNPALNQRINKVELKELSKEELIRILEDGALLAEKETDSFFTYQAILEIIKLADKHIFSQPNPQKSLTLLEKTAVESRGEIITAEKVQQIAGQVYKVPVGQIGEREKKQLLNLEEILHQRIVNQNQAVEEISEAMRRARAEIGRKGQRPIGSFLFLGPTGVGKTETAKALAESYFGGQEQMIRFDMSEYQNKEDLYRFLGRPEEGGQPGQLSEVLDRQPHSLLLFDEIEKAHPDILNLFLRILDEGVATNSQGKKLIFSNTIIIATSNAGANFIRSKIKAGVDPAQISAEILDYLMDQDIFKPEFLNRFSGVISFSPLNRVQIEQIARMKLAKLKEQIKAEKDIEIIWGDNVASEIGSRGYNPQMGARPMERAIEKHIESFIAKKILADELKKGDQLTVKVKDFES